MRSATSSHLRPDHAVATGTTAPPAPAIELRGVRRHFGSGEHRVQAVDGVDLTIRTGEIVALLGSNGAGKTTTLDMLLGLTVPSEGSVRVLGRPPARVTAAGEIAAVLQTGGLLSDLTVLETVQLIASLYGRDALARTGDVLARTDLGDIARRRISKCSGGEQQRVKFALALVAGPRILVLDEPTAGMDVNARRRFWDVMRADADAGSTILFATHYLEEAEQFAQRTVVMHRGRVVADAPTSELRAGFGARSLAITLRPDTRTAVLDELDRRPDIADLRVEGDRLSFRSANSDALAGLLLSRGAFDLEIATPTLETAFSALTEDER